MPISRLGPPIIRSGLPRGGSLSGTQKRQEFIHGFMTICPDTRILWVPSPDDTTTSTTVDPYARTVTWDATIAGQFETVGSGLGVTFDGSSDNGTMPDADAMAFGDSVNDQPFSIVAWVKITANTADKEILARYDLTTGTTKREWRFVVDNAEKITFQIWDESAGAYIGRLYNTALATDSWLMLAGTYDGSGGIGGVRIYSAASRIDDTNSTSGTYVGMENTAALTYIGASEAAAGTATNFFQGSLGPVALIGTNLSSLTDLWALKALGNAYLGLTL